LSLEVVARVIVAVASGGVPDWLIGYISKEAGVVSDQAVGSDPEKPASFIYAIYGPRVNLDSASMGLLEQPGARPVREYGIRSCPQSQLNRP
jgi:hypothetical protein